MDKNIATIPVACPSIIHGTQAHGNSQVFRPDEIANIPESLKQIPHWLVSKHWPKTPGESKISKRPVRRVNGKFKTVNAHDSASWLSFKDATNELSILCQDSEFEASTWGFTLTEDLGITFVDCDYPIGSPEADAFISQFQGSYAEESASGNVHALVFGVPDFSGQSAILNYECYYKNRYVAVTGKRLPESSLEITALPEAMAWFSGFFVVGAKIPSTKSTEANPVHLVVVDAALRFIKNYSYESWFRVAAGLHHDHGVDGFEIFHSWSQKDAAGYKNKADCETTYFSARREDGEVITCRSILYQAKQNAWDGSIPVDVALDHLDSSTKDLDEIARKVAEISSQGLQSQDLDDLVKSVIHRNQLGQVNGKLMDKIQTERSRLFQSREIPGVDRVCATTELLSPMLFPDCALTRTGVTIRATRENFEVLLKGYGISCKYDVISKEQFITIPDFNPCHDLQNNGVLQELVSIAERNGIPTKITENLDSVLGSHATNPVLAFFERTQWDQKDRLPDFCATVEVFPEYAGIRDQLLRLALLQVVAAVDHAQKSPRKDKIPKFEHILVLQGAGGIRKTTWIRALLPQELRTKYIKTGLNLDLSNKDSQIEAVSFAICELGELDATFRASDIAALKAFTSRTHDSIRLPYARLANRYERRTAFFASVNQSEFLRDLTGNRRFWVLGVKRLKEFPEGELQQLWAQIYHSYIEGQAWWPDEQLQQEIAAVNDLHLEKSPIVEVLESVFDLSKPNQGNLLTMTGLKAELTKDMTSDLNMLHTLRSLEKQKASREIRTRLEQKGFHQERQVTGRYWKISKWPSPPGGQDCSHLVETAET